LGNDTVRLYWKRSDGTPYAYLSSLPRALEHETGKLLPESDVSRLTGVRRGLDQTGYVEGWNFVMEYRWATASVSG
jgi:hypothetical protein